VKIVLLKHFRPGHSLLAAWPNCWWLRGDRFPAYLHVGRPMWQRRSGVSRPAPFQKTQQLNLSLRYVIC